MDCHSLPQGLALNKSGPTPWLMPKPKKTKPMIKSPEAFPVNTPPGYDAYVQEHRKKLKQLEREYLGDNLTNPPWGDHE